MIENFELELEEALQTCSQEMGVPSGKYFISYSVLSENQFNSQLPRC